MILPEIPGYQVLRELGSGGMSRVYLAVMENIPRKFAIKIIDPGLADDPSFIARFQREARTTGTIDDPNIVSVIDQGRVDDTYYIVMEYVEGIDLQKAIRKQVPPQEIGLLIVQEIAKALRAAHENSIIHRDIKPANVLLGFKGQVKVVDFGLARDFNSSRSIQLTMPSVRMGTPAFMSPEQSNAATTDHRTDIYSLGATAYDVLTGEITKYRKTSSELAERLFVEPPLTDLNPEGVQPKVKNLIKRMMARTLSKRVQTMDEVLKGIDECLREIPGASQYMARREEYLGRYARDPEQFCRDIRREKGIPEPGPVDTETATRIEPVGRPTSAVGTLRTRMITAGRRGKARLRPAVLAAGIGLAVAAVALSKILFFTGPRSVVPAGPVETGKNSGPAPAGSSPAPPTAPEKAAPATTPPSEPASEKTTPEKPVGEETAATPATGNLSVASTPGGASVVLRKGDQRKRGVTPFTFAGLSTGSWSVRIEKKGFEPLERTVDITGNSTLRLEETLTAMPAAAEAPDAGKPAEASPAGGDASKTGPEAAEKGFLEVLVSPFGAIYVNGLRVVPEGRVYRDSVNVGVYTVEVVHPTYGKKTMEQQRVERGKPLRLRFVFP